MQDRTAEGSSCGWLSRVNARDSSRVSCKRRLVGIRGNCVGRHTRAGVLGCSTKPWRSRTPSIGVSKEALLLRRLNVLRTSDCAADARSAVPGVRGSDATSIATCDSQPLSLSPMSHPRQAYLYMHLVYARRGGVIVQRWKIERIESDPESPCSVGGVTSGVGQ